MRRPRALLTLLLLAVGLSLAGCENLEDLFSNKKPLPGERKAVFPEGVPGVPHGVPAELVKGYQPPPEPAPVAEQAPEPPKAKVKPKPKPKRVASPARPGGVSIRPAGASDVSQQSQPSPFPPPPGASQQPQQPQQPQQSQQAPSPWPDPPKPGTFSR